LGHHLRLRREEAKDFLVPLIENSIQQTYEGSMTRGTTVKTGLQSQSIKATVNCNGVETVA
jgi:hypothetical protein